MTPPNESAPLGAATMVALVLVAIGAVLYVRAVFLEPGSGGGDSHGSTATSPAPPKPQPKELSSAARTSSLAASPAVLGMVTSPKVRPEDQFDTASQALQALVPELDRCYRALLEYQPTIRSRGSIHLEIGKDRGLLQPTVQFDGTNDEKFITCIKDQVVGGSFSALQPGTTVFWPLRMHPKTGLVLTRR